jgi:hypothetical protein
MKHTIPILTALLLAPLAWLQAADPDVAATAVPGGPAKRLEHREQA